MGAAVWGSAVVFQILLNCAVIFSDRQVLSSLQLQMSLYFNMWFFPLWWISESVMLHLKVRQHAESVSLVNRFGLRSSNQVRLKFKQRHKCLPVLSSRQYPALPDYYKFILVTVLILMTLIEAIRLFLGYAGNLQEKVVQHLHSHHQTP